MNRFTRYASLFLSLSFPLSCLGADLVLVKEGVSQVPILLFPGAPPKTRDAAVELADYIEKASGTRPDLLEKTPTEIPNNGIWVGYQPAVEKLFPEVDFDFKHPEEVLLTANENHLFIGGRDRWDPEHLDVQGPDFPIKGRQLEYGTANAVYTFLQEKLGVRWLFPGELGEDVPSQPTISLSPFEIRYHPQIRARDGVFAYSALGDRGYGKAQVWTRRQRLQLSSLALSGGHGFSTWWERYHETHPEIFALQPDGTRSGHPNPRTAKLCQSNPKVWELWLKDVEEQLEKDPNQITFNGSPNDGWSSGHCVCENCRAWDHPDAEPRLMHWYHFREERPALSDRHVTFANKLAGVLKERYPDKDYYVLMLSYGHSRPAPIAARPAENIIMVSVANFLGRTNLVDRGSTWGTTHREQFAAWGKLAHHLSWRPNTGSPAGWQQGLPDLSVNQTIEDFAFIGQNHCVGIFIDHIWEHWATMGPQYYVMAQMTWNPDQDGQVILDDYYDRAFGPGAEGVRDYFESIEEARMEFVKEQNYAGGVESFPELFTGELLAASDERLSQAESQLAPGDTLFRNRIAFVRTGLDYTRLLMDCAKKMSTYWDSPDETIAASVKENWSKIEALANKDEYAINWGPVRPSTPRMLGLHPDYPNPKRAKKPSAKEPEDLDQN